MSELDAAIHAAINDHLANEGGGIVTAFHVIAEYLDDDGEQCWIYTTPEDQRQSTTMGLIDWAHGVARYEQHRHLDDVSDD